MLLRVATYREQLTLLDLNVIFRTLSSIGQDIPRSIKEPDSAAADEPSVVVSLLVKPLGSVSVWFSIVLSVITSVSVTFELDAADSTVVVLNVVELVVVDSVVVIVAVVTVVDVVLVVGLTVLVIDSVSSPSSPETVVGFLRVVDFFFFFRVETDSEVRVDGLRSDIGDVVAGVDVVVSSNTGVGGTGSGNAGVGGPNAGVSGVSGHKKNG